MQDSAALPVPTCVDCGNQLPKKLRSQRQPAGEHRCKACAARGHGGGSDHCDDGGVSRSSGSSSASHPSCASTGSASSGRRSSPSTTGPPRSRPASRRTDRRADRRAAARVRHSLSPASPFPSIGRWRRAALLLRERNATSISIGAEEDARAERAPSRASRGGGSARPRLEDRPRRLLGAHLHRYTHDGCSEW